jgi:hypothetical protein
MISEGKISTFFSFCKQKETNGTSRTDSGGRETLDQLMLRADPAPSPTTWSNTTPA